MEKAIKPCSLVNGHHQDLFPAQIKLKVMDGATSSRQSWGRSVLSDGPCPLFGSQGSRGPVKAGHAVGGPQPGRGGQVCAWAGGRVEVRRQEGAPTVTLSPRSAAPHLTTLSQLPRGKSGPERSGDLLLSHSQAGQQLLAEPLDGRAPGTSPLQRSPRPLSGPRPELHTRATHPCQSRK